MRQLPSQVSITAGVGDGRARLSPGGGLISSALLLFAFHVLPRVALAVMPIAGMGSHGHEQSCEQQQAQHDKPAIAHHFGVQSSGHNLQSQVMEFSFLSVQIRSPARLSSCTLTSLLLGDFVITSNICLGVNCSANTADGSSAIVMARRCFIAMIKTGAFSAQQACQGRNKAQGKLLRHRAPSHPYCLVT